jgi:hypothetical protein
MSGPGFTRPDLCSIHAVAEQEKLAKAVRSGFSADGRPLGDDGSTQSAGASGMA